MSYGLAEPDAVTVQLSGVPVIVIVPDWQYKTLLPDLNIPVQLSLGLTKFDAIKRIREVAEPTDKAEDIIQKVLKSL